MSTKFVSEANLQEFATKMNAKQKTIFAPIEAVGSPLTAATAADMTDETKVYVYTGEEAGYTAGNWYYYDGTEWLSGGVYNATVYETDATLTESGKPADAKTVGDKINRIDGEILCGMPFVPESSNVLGFITNSNVWSTSANRYCGLFRIPEGTGKIAVQANADTYTYIAFLASSAHDNTTTPDYAAGWSSPVRMGAGETAEFEVPADGVFLYYSKQFNDTISTPQSITYYVGGFSALEVEKNGSLLSPVNVDRNKILFPDGINSATGETKTSSLYHTEYIDVSGFQNIIYSRLWSTSTSSTDTGMAFYDNEKNYISGQRIWFSTVLVTETLSYKIQYLTVPENAKYARFTWSASLGDFILYDAKQYYNSVTTQLSTMALQLGLHETPLDVNKLNIIKRARQMTDIKWTPAVDLDRYMLVSRGGAEIPDTASAQNYLGTFKAGVEYTGVPYGRVINTMRSGYNYNYATVGHYIDFGTFISSVANPKSALCKRDVGNVGNHISVIYATVCSGLTCYALDVPEVDTTGLTPSNVAGLSTIGKLNDGGELLPDNDILIGDILNQSGYHTGIITDIIRGDDRTIRFVEISEATTKGCADRTYDDGKAGGLCIRRGWTREQLYDVWGEYYVMRYYGTVPYTPNAYAPIAGELDAYRIEQFPIMPYEGEGFAFKTGYIPDNAVKLVITLGGYDYVKVFKDGVEVTGSPFAVTTDAQTNEIDDVSVSEIGEGSYTAYLCNIADGNVTNLTYACHWTVGVQAEA